MDELMERAGRLPPFRPIRIDAKRERSPRIGGQVAFEPTNIQYLISVKVGKEIANGPDLVLRVKAGDGCFLHFISGQACFSGSHFVAHSDLIPSVRVFPIGGGLAAHQSGLS